MNDKAKRTIAAEIKITYFDDGNLTFEGPADFMLCRHIMNATERVMINKFQEAMQAKEKATIHRPGLRHVMAIGKN